MNGNMNVIIFNCIISVRENYNNGDVNGPLHGPSCSGCLLLAHLKKKIAIFAGSTVPAATVVKLAVISAVGNI